MKIYTRTGDDGTTGLLGGHRLAKDHLRIEAYGTVDELSATLGMVRADRDLSSDVGQLLQSIQNDLFVMGAQLACPGGDEPACGTIQSRDIERLEHQIDHYEATLEPLSHFILPGGCLAAAHLHLARAVARRAERRVVTLAGQEGVGVEIIIYLNRLSDLLFVLARVANQQAHQRDIPWRDR